MMWSVPFMLLLFCVVLTSERDGFNGIIKGVGIELKRLNRVSGGMVLRKKQSSLYCESRNGVPFDGSGNSVSGYIFEMNHENFGSVRSTIREILEEGYSRLGGTRSDLDSVLSDKDSLYRIFSTSGNLEKIDSICAVQVYKVNFGVPRLRYIAGRGEYRSKGVYALIEYEIKTNGYCCFAEVSGAVEHMYAKSNGYIVPNVFASKILKQHRGIDPVKSNLFEYVHTYPDGVSHKKVLFGFKSVENFEKFNKKIFEDTDTFADYSDYEDFRSKTNALISGIKESFSHQGFCEERRLDLHDVLDTAESFLINLVDLHDEYQYNEFPVETFEQASFALKVVRELGTPHDYTEAKELYEHWRANVTELKPIMFTLG